MRIKQFWEDPGKRQSISLRRSLESLQGAPLTPKSSFPIFSRALGAAQPHGEGELSLPRCRPCLPAPFLSPSGLSRSSLYGEML